MQKSIVRTVFERQLKNITYEKRLLTSYKRKYIPCGMFCNSSLNNILRGEIREKYHKHKFKNALVKNYNKNVE